MGYEKQRKHDGRAKAKGKPAGSSGKVAFADFRFVRIELLADEKESFRTLLAAGEFEDFSVDNFIADGYTVKYSPQDRTETVVCSVSQPNADHPNSGLVLTGRGGDAATALAVCAYKHLYLCEDCLWREAEDRRGGQYNDIG